MFLDELQCFGDVTSVFHKTVNEMMCTLYRICYFNDYNFSDKVKNQSKTKIL